MITNINPILASIQPAISVDMLDTRMIVNSDLDANCASAQIVPINAAIGISS